HVSRHMARNAAAGLAGRGVPGMPFGMVTERLVALQAHLIGIGREFERCRIPGWIVRVRIMARYAGSPAFLEAARSFEGFADESGCAEAAVAVKNLMAVIRNQ